MVEAEDYLSIQSRRKAISALLPYVIRQEQGGQPEVFGAVMRAARASRMSEFIWRRIGRTVYGSLHGASPHVIVSISPHTPWALDPYFITEWEYSVQWWTAAASVVPYTEEVAQSVVDMLLQFMAAPNSLEYAAPNSSEYITTDHWTWLTKRPSLPPVCLGRGVGTYTRVVEAVRALKDVEVLKSYFLLIWSEWNGVLSDSYKGLWRWTPNHSISFGCPLSSGTPSSDQSNTSNDISCSLCLMRISIQEDFGGVGMESHRADLVYHLNHVLAQLDRGLEYFEQHNPETNAGDLPRRKEQYEILREALLETNMKAISCTPHLPITPSCVLTPTPGARSIPRNVYVRTPSSMPVVSRPECPTL